MDPNANLQEQERILHYNEHSIIQTPTQKRFRSARLRDLREALNTWFVNGGFEPDWTKAPNAAKYYGQAHKATGYGTR